MSRRSGYIVSEGTQVRVAGTVYGPGDTFDAAEEEVAEALETGCASAISSERSAPTKRKR